MKKRKSPYILATVLVVALGAIFFMNATAPTTHEGHPETEPQATPTIVDPKSSVLDSMKKGASVDGSSMRPLVKKVKLPEGTPKFARPVRAPEKPVPSKGDTNSQWYLPETNSGK